MLKISKYVFSCFSDPKKEFLGKWKVVILPYPPFFKPLLNKWVIQQTENIFYHYLEQAIGLRTAGDPWKYFTKMVNFRTHHFPNTNKDGWKLTQIILK